MLVVRHSISVELAKQLVEKAEDEAARNQFAVSIAVVNEAGYLVFFLKMDNSTNISGEIAIAKAMHAVNYQRDTKYHEEFLKQGQVRVLALPNTLSIEGGIQLVHDGQLIGAIGVSGAPSVEDGRIAQAGADYLKIILQ